MTVNRSFTSMPDVPMNSKLTSWQAEFMRATKTNLDLLMGANGVAHTAMIRGDVQVNTVTAEPITGAFTAADHLLVVTELRLTTIALNTLISQLN